MSKKTEERPMFICNKCGCKWVYHSPMCIICGIPGKPLNSRAEKIIRKVRGGNNDSKAEM